MKRFARRMMLLLLSLLLSVSAQAVATDEPVSTEPDVYHIMEAEENVLVPKSAAYAGQFEDVSAEQWFYPYVTASYEYGLIRGRSPARFDPGANVTVAELLTLSARIHAAYDGDAIPDALEGETWYLPYVRYLALEHLLPSGLADYGDAATRSQLAGIFALSLPEQCFTAQNGTLVTDAYNSGDYITDVNESTPNQPQILWLYRQGLLTGMDEVGSYWPDRTTTRAEVAAVVTRMVDPSLRTTLDWTVLPRWSAAGKTLPGLIEAPESVTNAPSYTDEAAIDALVRQMLANGSNTITLRYPAPLTQSDAQTLADLFTTRVKVYCEQMYNAVVCQRYYRSGLATLTFYATACADADTIRSEELEAYRDKTMAKAIEIHDMLWETGQLTADMSQYDIAKVYFGWLCDHCEYDWAGASKDDSISHIAYSALIDGKSVCDGYTGAYNLFLKLEGIECRALPSTIENHIWTVATLDGTEYHIDVTWGDQSGRVDMRYFGMTAAQSYAAHSW